jgi:hypothetical protein
MLGNRVYETANAPGTGTAINLIGPKAGYVGFVSAFGSGASCYYEITDGSQSEIQSGTVTAGAPNKLTRGTPMWTSVHGVTNPTRLNFTGEVSVFCVLPAQKALYRDANGHLALGAFDLSARNVTLTGNLTASGTLSAGPFYATSASITAAGDAVVQLEPTGQAVGSYRRKQIIASPNIGDGWLFRTVRPSDNAVVDYTLGGPTGGIWTSGNFDPASKANVSHTHTKSQITDFGTYLTGVVAKRVVYSGVNMGAGDDLRACELEIVNGTQVRLVESRSYRTAADPGGGD